MLNLNQEQPIDELNNMQLILRIANLPETKVQAILNTSDINEIATWSPTKLRETITNYLKTFNDAPRLGDILEEKQTKKKFMFVCPLEKENAGTFIDLASQTVINRHLSNFQATGKTVDFRKCNQYLLDSVPITEKSKTIWL